MHVLLFSFRGKNNIRSFDRAGAGNANFSIDFTVEGKYVIKLITSPAIF